LGARGNVVSSLLFLQLGYCGGSGTIKGTPSNRLMPRVSAEHKQLYKSKIRGLLSQNPQITQRELQARLEQDGIRLDRKCLGQLLRSVYAERAKRTDTWTLNTALAAFQDAMAEIARAGWEIINDPMARNMEKTLAMREAREAYNVIFEKLFDAGGDGGA
jgi:hypothetical protein